MTAQAWFMLVVLTTPYGNFSNTVPFADQRRCHAGIEQFAVTMTALDRHSEAVRERARYSGATLSVAAQLAGAPVKANSNTARASSNWTRCAARP